MLSDDPNPILVLEINVELTPAAFEISNISPLFSVLKIILENKRVETNKKKNVILLNQNKKDFI